MKTFSTFTAFTIGFLMGIVFIVLLLNVTGGTYEDGQIDAINGKVYYELILKENGEIEWEKIENE